MGQSRFARTNTERVEMLLLNFLIGRILINHVIVRPEDCPALGISKSRLDTSTSHGQRIKKNLRMLASLLWEILRRLPGHEGIPEAQNTGHFEEERSGDKGKKKANDKKDKDKGKAQKDEKSELKRVEIEYTKDTQEECTIELDEKHQIISNIEDDSILAKAGIN